jgi:hypothetical protein
MLGKLGLMAGGIMALVTFVKPIKQLLEVVGAIISIGLKPLLPLLRIFLIMFLKVGIELMKMFTGKGLQRQKEGLAEGRGIERDTEDMQEGSLGKWIEEIKQKFTDWLLGLFSKWNPVSMIGGLFKSSLMLISTGLMNIVLGFFEVLGGVVDIIIGVFTLDFDLIVQGILSVITGVINIFIGLIKTISGFVVLVGTIIWAGLKTLIDAVFKGLGALKDAGIWIWDKLTSIFSNAFNVLKGIGSWIWNKITGFFGGGGGSTSHDDVLITSSGEVHDFHPRDNILAFKDSPPKMGGTTINIKVDGFVGDEDLLAEKIEKAISSRNRGGLSQF